MPAARSAILDVAEFVRIPTEFMTHLSLPIVSGAICNGRDTLLKCRNSIPFPIKWRENWSIEFRIIRSDSVVGMNADCSKNVDD
jgi:hypothetical protein